MQHLIYVFGIIIQLLRLLVIINAQCPEYFRYFRNETSGDIMGMVEIPSPPKGVSLHLRVILSVATVLPTKYVGQLELLKTREESIRSVLQGMSLYYQIYFPVRNPIPVVTSITLNDLQYCTGPPVIGVIVTKIILEHTLYPPRVIIPLTEQLLNFLANHTNASTTTTTSDFPTNRRTTILSDDKEVTTTTLPTSSIHSFVHPTKHRPVDSSCGLISETNPLITRSEATTPITWPWLAAIFLLKDELEYQCAGNLISRQYVLTVAHCLRQDDENVPPNMLLVSLGRINLQDWSEPGIINVDVADYKFHPDYRNPISADSDLAIVKLMERIDYTPTVRPICLWMGKPELEVVVGKSGFVIGWGFDGTSKRHFSLPRFSKVPIVSQEDCLRSNPGFIDVTSNRTFCAGKKDGKGPCNGDSGSGLVMYHARYNRYHLRGIVSLSLLDVRTRSCDLNEYLVYVDIAKYLHWIRQEMIS